MWRLTLKTWELIRTQYCLRVNCKNVGKCFRWPAWMELSTQIVIICLTIKVEPGRYKSGQNKSHTRFENRSNFPLILPEYLTPELNSVLYGTSSHQEVLYVFARRHCDRPGVKLDSSGCWGWAQEGNSPLRRPLRVSSKKTLRQKTIPFPQSSWASGRKNSRIEVKRKMKESCWLHRLITDCVTVCVCVWQALSLLPSMLRGSVRSEVVGGHFLSISRRRI